MTTIEADLGKGISEGHDKSTISHLVEGDVNGEYYMGAVPAPQHRTAVNISIGIHAGLNPLWRSWSSTCSYAVGDDVFERIRVRARSSGDVAGAVVPGADAVWGWPIRPAEEKPPFGFGWTRVRASIYGALATSTIRSVHTSTPLADLGPICEALHSPRQWGHKAKGNVTDPVLI